MTRENKYTYVDVDAMDAMDAMDAVQTLKIKCVPVDADAMDAIWLLFDQSVSIASASTQVY